MSHAVADAQVAALFVIKQDREQIVGQHALHNLGDVREKLIEIERLRRGRRNFQQEIEQFRPFAKSHRGFARSVRGVPMALGWGGSGSGSLNNLDAGAGADARRSGRGHGAQILQRADAARSLHAHLRTHCARIKRCRARWRRRC